jgi:hypothetical protein
VLGDCAVKINDIVIDEGLGDSLKGAWQGFQQSRAQNKAVTAGGANLQMELNQWKEYVTQRAPVVNMKDPATFQQEIKKWANTRYPSAGDEVDVSTVQPNNARSAQNYITNMYNTAMANRTAGKTAGSQSKNVATELINKLIDKAETSGNRISLNDVSTEITASPELTRLNALDRRTMTKSIVDKLKDLGVEVVQDPHGVSTLADAPALSPGIGVVSSDPVVLSYDKRKYALNRSNQWVVFGSTKTASPEMNEFLNKQLRAM